jgi:hypothetical protein
MQAILIAVLQAFLAAFAEAFANWLKDRQSAAAAQSVGTLTAGLNAANEELQIDRDAKAIADKVRAETDDQARQEALKWARQP